MFICMGHNLLLAVFGPSWHHPSSLCRSNFGNSHSFRFWHSGHETPIATRPWLLVGGLAPVWHLSVCLWRSDFHQISDNLYISKYQVVCGFVCSSKRGPLYPSGRLCLWSPLTSSVCSALISWCFIRCSVGRPSWFLDFVRQPSALRPWNACLTSLFKLRPSVYETPVKLLPEVNGLTRLLAFGLCPAWHCLRVFGAHAPTARNSDFDFWPIMTIMYLWWIYLGW